MKQAFLLVSALFVLFQLGEKVTAASIEASSGNTESDQQDQIQYTEDEINRIVDRVTDSLNNYFDSFEIEFHEGHENVSELIIAAANVPDDAPEEVKTAVQSFRSTFDNKNAQVMALLDTYQEQGVQLLDRVREDIQETMKTFISDVNAAKESSASSAA